MVKRNAALSALIILLTPALAADSIMVHQLLWDHDAARDYASRLASHPPIPDLPEPRELHLSPEARVRYTRLWLDLQDLESERSRTVIAAYEVQDELSRLDDWLLRIENFIREVFGGGLRADIRNLVTAEARLSEAHTRFMSRDISDVLEDITRSEDLSAFSGLVSVDGVTYSGLQARADRLPPVQDFSSLVSLSDHREPGCYIQYFNETIAVPRYIFETIYSDSTPLCSPEEFYTEGDLGSLVVWGPEWSKFSKRLVWVDDLGKYLSVVQDLTWSERSKALKNLDRASHRFDQAREIQTLLSNSSVELALSALPGDNTLSARPRYSNSLDRLNETHDRLWELAGHAESSSGLGTRFADYREMNGLYVNLDSHVSLLWTSMETKVRMMESLCDEYGSSCSFGGDLPSRLEKTSDKFLEVRMSYLLDQNRDKEARLLSLHDLENRIESLEALINDIEPYTDSSLSVRHRDALDTFRHELDLVQKAPLTDIKGLSSRVSTAQRDISNKFFIDHRDEALSIKAELTAISTALPQEVLNFTFRDLPISAFGSRPLEGILYYLSLEPLLEELRLKQVELLSDFSSDLPSLFECSPKVPPLGPPFQVSCSILVNNTWDIPLDSASSVIRFPHQPHHIDASNFIGDVAHLKSVSFSGDEVRLNIKDIPGAAWFEATYTSQYNSPHRSCAYSTSGITAKYSCLVYATCPVPSGTLSLSHPFQGRAMNSSHEYLYDGKNVLVEIPCGAETELLFTGPSVEVSSSGESLSISSLINASLDLELELPTGNTDLKQPVTVGASLDPFETKEVSLETDFKLTPPIDEIKLHSENLSIPIGYDSFQEASDALLSDLPTSYGCIEDNIIKTVRASRAMPSPDCINLNFSQVIALRDSGDHEEAVKEFLRQQRSAEVEAYLSRAQAYQEEAANAVSGAREATSNPLTRQMLGVYVEKAEEAYAKKDYISALYYARYALGKSDIHLGIDFRTLVALGIIAYGIYTSRQDKKEDELI